MHPSTLRRVYPRVCGGTPFIAAHSLHDHGLSPRVRGNHALRSDTAESVRSIPACAGEPKKNCGTRGLPGVYPRVCGGTASAAAALKRRKGSIPACAGEPVCGVGCDGMSWVYPRVCGGTPPIPRPSNARSGLSPRVRGNLYTLANADGRLRSIPACAGEPESHLQRRVLDRVYPRVCGGTRRGGALLTAGTGLSPRVRGNPAYPIDVVDVAGSIPACAGEPSAMLWGRPLHAVYPRVCGGTFVITPPTARDTGLSPRVRGNRAGGAAAPPLIRSIPACAGEPSSPRRPRP